ncbi:MAG: penicillin-binding protein 2 [Chloroflexi bacterium]|nr:penicillin-binding protein 2 [Chloroflexota bacterium]
MNAQNRGLRFLLFQVAIVASFVILAIPLWRLQIAEGGHYRLRADENRYYVVSTNAPRGVIYDRTGKVLARNMPRFSVRLLPKAMADDAAEEQVLERLISMLNGKIAGASLSNRPSNGENLHIEDIRKQLQEGQFNPYQPIVIADNIPRDVALAIMEEHENLPGVEVTVRAQRQYVEGKLLSHVLGFVGSIPAEQVDRYVGQPNSDYTPQDIVGLSGVEYVFENTLRGHKGQRQTEVDVAGREVRMINEVPAVAGHNLIITIDLDLQRVAAEALRKQMAIIHSKSGVVIAMNPQNGQILALVSLPSYDDNLFVGGISTNDYNRLTKDAFRPLLNHAISGVYPPGSTFKIVTALAALEENVIDRNTYINDPGTIWLPNKYFPDDPTLAQPFYCWYKPGHGELNVVGALAQSCDVFFYEVGGGYREFQGLGIEKLADYSRLLGFGRDTGIDLPGESAGLVPNRKWKRLNYGESWVTGDTYNMAIGQGAILATPLQVLNATAAIANGGTLYQPQLVYQVQDADGNVLRGFQPDIIRRLPVSQDNLNLVREGLRQAVLNGTARHVSIPGISIAGKTGTAEFPGRRDREGNLPTHAWFTAFAPFQNPQIAIVAFVYGGGEGSAVSVPIARKILQAYFQAHPLSGSEGSAPGTPPASTGGAPPPSAPSPTPAGQPGSFQGHIVSVQPQEKEISTLSGQVIDRFGNGIPGTQVTLDGGGPPVAQFATGPNGEFQYDYFNPASSPTWNIRLTDLPGAPVLTVQVQPFKHYVVEFREGR